jgi:hypothetical protein
MDNMIFSLTDTIMSVLRPLGIVMMLLLMTHLSIAQESGVIQGIVLYRGNPKPFYKISFTGLGDVVTNSDGTFRLQLSETYDNPSVEFRTYDTLRILEPSEGRLPAYTDPDYFHKIILGSPEDKKYIAIFRKELDARMNEIASSSSLKTEALLAELYDSISAIRIEKEELSYIIEMQKRNFRTRRVLPVIDSVYDIYLSRTKDLRDAMIQYGEKVFYNPVYTGFVQERIDGYNGAYELLIARKGFIINLSELYWDEPVPSEVRRFIEYETLQNFHRRVVLKSNVGIINSITAYNNREKGRRKRNEIENDINVFVIELNTGIDYISDAQNRLVQKMKSL